MKIVLRLATAIAMLALGGLALTAQNGNDLFQQALIKERTQGDVPSAIRIYERIVREFPSNRLLVAKALFQIGSCYEKLNDAQARKYYQQVVNEFGDQVNFASEARKRLIALSNPNVSTQSMVQRKLWQYDSATVGKASY